MSNFITNLAVTLAAIKVQGRKGKDNHTALGLTFKAETAGTKLDKLLFPTDSGSISEIRVTMPYITTAIAEMIIPLEVSGHVEAILETGELSDKMNIRGLYTKGTVKGVNDSIEVCQATFIIEVVNPSLPELAFYADNQGHLLMLTLAFPHEQLL